MHVHHLTDLLCVLQLVAEASGKTKAELLSGLLENLQPALNKRLLIPLRHVPTQTGYAAGLTYCLQQDPPLVSLTPVIVSTYCVFSNVLSRLRAIDLRKHLWP